MHKPKPTIWKIRGITKKPVKDNENKQAVSVSKPEKQYPPLSKAHQTLAYALYLDLEKRYAKKIGSAENQTMLFEAIAEFLEEQKFGESGMRNFFSLIDNAYAQGGRGIKPANQIITAIRNQRNTKKRR